MRLRILAVAVVLAIGAAGFSSMGAARAATGTPKFLTLPFESTAHMVLQQAWYFPSGYYHHGIDYVHGRLDRVNTWKNFPVVAAAAGEACADCFPGVGKVVLIKHRVGGKTFYTYYGHFKSIVDKIPCCSQSHTVHVDRGEVIGTAGASGDPAYLIHLHFELRKANFNVVDPYGIYSTRNYYPNPKGTNGKKSKRRNYWTTNPPTLANTSNAAGGTDGEVHGPSAGGSGGSDGPAAPAIPTYLSFVPQLPAAIPTGLLVYRGRAFRKRRRRTT